MNNIIGWLTRVRVFFISLIGFIVYIVSKFSIDIGICSSYASKCSDKSYLFVIFSFIFIPIFIFSLITFKLKESVFNSWRSFSIWAVFFIIVIVTFFPTRISGFDVVSVTKGLVMFFLTILYSIISLIFIIYKSIKKE